MPTENTLRHWLHEARAQAPRLARTTAAARGFGAGPGRVPPDARVAVSLRLARLLGCPVCRRLFPALAGRARLDPEDVARALDGDVDRLPPPVAGAVAWAEAVAVGDGAEPASVPAAAQALTPEQRDHLTFFVRLELLVHATGLFFLPHSWVERAAAS